MELALQGGPRALTEPNLLQEIAGRRILITGASSGIGAAVARQFGACGAHVGVHYHSNRRGADAVAAAIEASGGHAATIQRDLSVRGEAAGLVEEAANALGGLDLLINNAGDMLDRHPLSRVGDDDLDHMVDLNIRPVVIACATAVPFLRNSTAGSIINVTSIAAHSGGSNGGNLYAAAKGFITTYTRALARELACDGIRVNAVAPGVIDTALHTRWTAPEVFEKFPALIPLGRVGRADDCVGAFIFLACTGMSGYLTGQVIEVNGGQYMA